MRRLSGYFEVVMEL